MTFTTRVLVLAATLSVLAAVDAAQAQCQTQKLTGFDIVAGDEFGGGVGIDGDIAVVGMAPSAPAGPRRTSGYVFERNLGGPENWGFRGKLEPDDVVLGDGGCRVAVGGNYIVIGYERHDHDGEDDGGAYIFERDPGNGMWSQCTELRPSPPDGQPGDWFGTDVAISGNLVLVGARNIEKAFLFDLTDGCDQWTQVATLTTVDTPTSNGNTVAISGDVAVLGGVLDNHSGFSHPGSAYIYHRNQGGADNWGLVKKVTAEGDATDDGFFGTDVAIDGDTIVVTANLDVHSQSVVGYVFERDLGGTDNWGRRARITPLNCGGRVSVSIAGDIILMGSGCTFRSGANGTWDDGSVDQVETASPCDAPGGFGLYTAIDESTAIIGAQLDDDTCPGEPGCQDSGSAYVFDLACNCDGVAGCSGHGCCVGPDTCQCDDGYTGPDCSTPTDIPAVSEWGLIVMALLVLSAGTLAYARRCPSQER